jgi:diacylglycerol kinase
MNIKKYLIVSINLLFKFYNTLNKLISNAFYSIKGKLEKESSLSFENIVEIIVFLLIMYFLLNISKTTIGILIILFLLSIVLLVFLKKI